MTAHLVIGYYCNLEGLKHHKVLQNTEPSLLLLFILNKTYYAYNYCSNFMKI